MDRKRVLSDAYVGAVARLSETLWHRDPERIGSTILGPRDEYEASARRLLSQSEALRSPSDVEAWLSEMFRQSLPDLAAELYAAISDFRSAVGEQAAFGTKEQE